jgi:hypothetical protein
MGDAESDTLMMNQTKNHKNHKNLTAEAPEESDVNPWSAYTEYPSDYDMVDDGPSYLNQGWAPVSPVDQQQEQDLPSTNLPMSQQEKEQDKQSPSQDEPPPAIFMPTGVTLSNVVKYDHGNPPLSRDHFARLYGKLCHGQCLFCPKLGHLYTFCLPKSSPNSDVGQWSRRIWNLKSIQMCEHKAHPVSLWNKVSDGRDNDIQQILRERMECYLVPMNDIYYSYWPGDQGNYDIYVKNEGVFHYSNITDKMDTLEFHEVSPEYQGNLYRLKDNSAIKLPQRVNPPSEGASEEASREKLLAARREIYSRRREICARKGGTNVWKSVIAAREKAELKAGWEICTRKGGTHVCKKARKKAEMEAHTGEDDPASDSDASCISLTSDEEETADTPSVRSESGREGHLLNKNVSFTGHFSNDEKMRPDPHDGRWYTKDEFYDYYHTDRIWEMQHPYDVHLRNVVYETVEYAQTMGLSDTKTRLLLHSVMRTY